MIWTTAATVHVCKECGEDIWPGEIILSVLERYRELNQWRHKRVIYCLDCGRLYKESQELGSDA